MLHQDLMEVCALDGCLGLVLTRSRSKKEKEKKKASVVSYQVTIFKLTPQPIVLLKLSKSFRSDTL